MILNKQQARVPSEHFDFADWESAFDHYNRMIAEHGHNLVQFVCSQHPYTSGYWVEPAGCECSVGDDLIPAERVSELRSKVKAEINAAKSEGRTPKFITI